MKIKKATLKDAGKIASLIRQTIEKANKKDYTKKQLNAWLKYNSLKEMRRRLKENDVFMLQKNDRIVGTVSLSKNKIEGLFVKHTQLRKGIGKKLMDFIEAHAKKKGIKKLKLTSTPYAFKFYKRIGYKPIKKVKVYLFGVGYTEMKMEKKLE